jgi:predicted small lipoprotein YifL
MKKLIAPVALAAALALTGCGGSGATPTAATPTGAADSKPAEKAPQVPDLSGAWKQSNPNSEKSYQQATITADVITVEWVTDGGNTASIYWVGTFKAPSSSNGPYTWTSQRDVAATKSALLASSDATKEFTYDGDTISYKVSAMGTTTTVKLKKK